MATGPTGTGSKVLTLGMCGVAPAGPQRAKVTRGPVACGGVWAMHLGDTVMVLNLEPFRPNKTIPDLTPLTCRPPTHPTQLTTLST